MGFSISILKTEYGKKSYQLQPKEIKHVPTPQSTDEALDEDVYKSAGRSNFHLLATGALRILRFYQFDIHLNNPARLSWHISIENTVQLPHQLQMDRGCNL